MFIMVFNFIISPYGITWFFQRALAVFTIQQETAFVMLALQSSMKTCQLPCNCHPLTDCACTVQTFLRLGSFTLILDIERERNDTTQYDDIYIYIPLQANMKTSVCFKPTSNATNTATVNRHFEKWSARLRASQRYTASSQVFTVNWQLSTADRKYVTVSWKHPTLRAIN